MEEITNDLPETLEVVDIQFRPGQKVYYFDPNGMRFAPGDPVIMDTARGPEFGTCAGANHIVNRNSRKSRRFSPPGEMSPISAEASRG